MDLKKEKEWLLREKYQGKETPAYFEDVKKLQSGEPVDYVIGNRSFLDSFIDLSFRPLIPREETEFWVKEVLYEISEVHAQENLEVLDIFSGSGCIGIAVLKRFPDFLVDFSDKNELAIKQIKKNIALNHVEHQAHVFVSDVFQNIPVKQYDLIFANPPYIPTERFLTLPSSVRNFEPKEALLAENGGLSFIYQIIEQAPTYLKSQGKLFIEFDSPQKNLLEKKLKEHSGLSGDFIKDQYDRFRVLELTKK